MLWELAPRFAGCGDTVDLSVGVPAEVGPGWEVNWVTDRGQLAARGIRAQVMVPSAPDTVTVSALLSNHGKIIAVKAARIVVAKQFVILKADDLVYDPAVVLSDRWRRFIELIERGDLAAGLGLVANSLHKGGTRYASALDTLIRESSFEIWNHGYDHALNVPDASGGDAHHEFKNVGVEQQLSHLRQAQELVRERLGITMRAFGAPGNAIDAATGRALDEVPEIETWLFGLANSKKLVLLQEVRAESATGVVDYQMFAATYKATAPYIVLQIHPNDWGPVSFDNFERIVTTLRRTGAAFVTPSEYHDYLRRPGRAAGGPGA